MRLFHAENIICVQSFILLSGSAWALGGRLDGAYYAIGIFGMASVLPMIMEKYRRERYSDHDDCMSKWTLLPWAILSLIVAVSVMNPAYKLYENTRHSGFSGIEHSSFLPISISPERTLEFAVMMGGALVHAVALFYVMQSRTRIRQLLLLLIINAVVLAVVGIYFHLTGEKKILGIYEWSYGKFFASFRYHNHWGAFAILSMSAVMALASFWMTHYRSKSRGENPAWLVLLAVPILGMGVLISKGRLSTFLAAFLIAAFVSVILLRMIKGHTVGRSYRRLLFFSCLSVIAVYVASVAAPDLRYMINKTHGQVMQDEKTHTQATRLDFSRDTMRMAIDRPVWGWGLGSYLYGFRFFADEKYYNHLGRPQIMEFAHNDWLQLLAELGSVGFICLLVVPLIVFIRVIIVGKYNEISFWLIAGCASVLLLALVDFPLSNPAVWVSFTAFGSLAFKYAFLEGQRV